MPNGGEYLGRPIPAGASDAILGIGGTQGFSDAERAANSASMQRGSGKAAQPLRILILGGTGFLGPHHVRAALQRGHKVAVFSRGKSAAELPAGVERLIGERHRDLEPIRNRDWDAVIDIAAYVPSEIRMLGQALKGRVKHYTFISSVAVYENRDISHSNTDEQGELREYVGAVDPYSMSFGEGAYHYGTFKVLCEREAEQQFSGRTLVVRLGVIVGPGDNINAFTYLCARMEAGGEVLVAGDPLQQMQIIDVRDVAERTIRWVESGETGALNVTGPPMRWAEMLDALRSAPSVPVKLAWVPVSWVTEQAVTSFSNVLFFPMEAGFPGVMHINNDKARTKGLTLRSLNETSGDTRAWFKSLPVEQQSKVLMGFNGKSGFEESMQREREMLAAWYASQTEG